MRTPQEAATEVLRDAPRRALRERLRWWAIDGFCALVSLLILVAILLHANAQEPQAAPTPAPAQATPAAPTQPNSFQAVLLENAQLKVLRAQDVMQAALTNWNATCDAVKQTNNWPKDAQCDLRTSPVAIRLAPPQPSQSRPKPEAKP